MMLKAKVNPSQRPPDEANEAWIIVLIVHVWLIKFPVPVLYFKY